MFRVVCGIEDLGWVHPLSFAGFGQRPVIISLGGRAWEVTHLDEDRSVAHVRPADAPGRSRWLGESRALSYKFCRTVRALLLDEATESYWSKRAAAEISSARADTSFVRAARLVIEAEARNDRARWWTFGGLKANASLAAMLQTKGGVVPRFDNYFVDIPGTTRSSEVDEQLKAIVSTPHPNGIGDIHPPARIKFWDCLPVDLQAQIHRIPIHRC